MSCILCLGVWCDPWLLRKGPTYFSPWAASWKTSLVVSNASHSKLFRATLVTAVFLLTSAFSNIFFLIENSTRCFRQMTLKSPGLSRLLLSTGQRADVLRAGLKGLIDGSLQVVPPIIGMIYGQAVFFSSKFTFFGFSTVFTAWLLVDKHWCVGFLTQAPKLAPQTAKQIEEGYIFMDWFAIPQLHIASDDSFSELKSQQEMAIQSIPGYVC